MRGFEHHVVGGYSRRSEEAGLGSPARYSANGIRTAVDYEPGKNRGRCCRKIIAEIRKQGRLHSCAGLAIVFAVGRLSARSARPQVARAKYRDRAAGKSRNVVGILVFDARP